MNKKIILFGILLISVFLLSNISAVCCEKTISTTVQGKSVGGAWCQDVADANQCDVTNGLRKDSTACESTKYCSTGTCVNSKSGTCLPSSKTRCDTSLGGYWYETKNENEIERCKVGCCLIGDSGFITKKVTCDALAIANNADSQFIDSITDLATCLQNINPNEKGACITETEEGRDCVIDTKKNCGEKEFHAGKLCTAPDLGTICKMTPNTKCVDGKSEVYFEDSCHNTANVYDSSKADNTNYWTYIKEPTDSDICGQGSSNALSPGCGNCNYALGSVCGTARAGESVTYGKYICKNLNCTFNGKVYSHGQTWCAEPLANFEKANPGKLSYIYSCYNGEVTPTLCGNWRENLCWENETAKYATCIKNNWGGCSSQTNSKDCLNTDKRDCRIETGISYQKDANGKDILFTNWENEVKTEIKAACVPKYPPAFKFWEPGSPVEGSTEITPTIACGGMDTLCVAVYVQNWGLGWRQYEMSCYASCKENCSTVPLVPEVCEEGCLELNCPSSDCLENGNLGGKLNAEVNMKSDWATQNQELCVSLGDCGVKPNYLNKNSYSSWKEFFTGNYTKSSLPNADSYGVIPEPTTPAAA